MGNNSHSKIKAEEDFISWNSFKTFRKQSKPKKNLSLASENKNTQTSKTTSDEFPENFFNFDRDTNSVSRRNFLKIFGGTAAFASLNLAGCRRPEAYLIPYIKQPEWVIPGKALLYSTTIPHHLFPKPVVVHSHEGRPTYLKSNTLHPDTNSGLDPQAQASIFDLYQPDRSKNFLNKGKKISRKQGLQQIEKLRQDIGNGEQTAIFLNENLSPSTTRAIKILQKKYPKLKIYQRDVFTQNCYACANRDVFAKNIKQLPNLKNAQRILAFDCDFLGSEQISNKAINDFSQNRQVENLDTNGKVNKKKAMNRLYVAETAMSITGGMADHRLRLTPAEISFGVASLAKKLGIKGKLVDEILELQNTPNDHIEKWLEETSKDLTDNKKKSLVILGSQHKISLHILVALINDKLGAFGSTIELTKIPKNEAPPTKLNLVNLRKNILNGKIKKLISMHALDLSYLMPDYAKWEEVRKRINHYIHFSSNGKQDALDADLHIPSAHFLESWGDARSSNGTYSLIQPLIKPIFGGLSELTFLLSLASDLPLTKDSATSKNDDEQKETDKEKQKLFVALGLNDEEEIADEKGNLQTPDSYDYLFVKETFNDFKPDGKSSWEECLRQGYLKDSAYKTTRKRPKKSVINLSITKKHRQFLIDCQNVKDEKNVNLQVKFAKDYKLWDGRYYDNTQLQETPDPVTKLTWDNAALVSLKTAEKLGARNTRDGNFADSGDTFSVLKIEFEQTDRVLEIPVLPCPGHADDAITINLGYGQKLFSADKQDPEKNAKIREEYGGGFNGYKFLPNNGMGFFSLAKAEIAKGKTYKLALSQESNTMEGRAIAREGTIEDYDQKIENAKRHHAPLEGAFGQKQGMDTHVPENIPIYKPNNLNGEPLLNDEDHQWGMTIDLNTCTGCNSCLMACQSENNIPIVGKQQVLRGREMHWIRVDRYFASPKGREDEPEMIAQPVACQHCEFAPCEVVCPVNATVHSPDGLNVMAYNRCIGTRYCANNCPYKVRRFNYFDFNKRPFDSLYSFPARDKKEIRLVESLGKNPNVSVRMRGVMEKCTYCIQRIQSARISQKVKAKSSANTRVATGSVVVACQEACPADAINFGNLLDKKDKINSELYKKSPRNYDLLQYLGVEPRTSFLARVKNPNPKMPGAEYVGKATINIH